ncbi:MAG: archaeosortase/exosortase family protein, partial [Bacteroidota bacterium]
LVINNTVYFTSRLLDLLGFASFTSHDDTIRTVGIDGTHGLWIGDPCNGIALFSLFTFFIIAYPGPWKKKLWYIPLGILSIHIINILRITALCIIVLKRPEYLEFNHTYTFTILVTAYVFLLWMIWARKFGRLKQEPKRTGPADAV